MPAVFRCRTSVHGVNFGMLFDRPQLDGKDPAVRPVGKDDTISLELIKRLEKLLHVRGCAPEHLCDDGHIQLAHPD